MDALLRRYRDTLMIVGRGNLLFGIWGMIRTVMTYIISSDEREKLIADFRSAPEYQPDLEIVFYVLFFVIMLVVLLLEISLRIYIYRASRAESMGEHRSILYLIVAALIAGVSLFSVWYSVFKGYYGDMDIFDICITIAIETTSSILLLDLVRSSIRVRQLSRKLEG